MASKITGPAGFVMLWILFTIAIIFLIQARNYIGMNPIVRQRILVKEAFQAGGGAVGGGAEQVLPRLEEAGGGQAPADAELEVARAPYSLLKGWLPASGVESVDQIKLNAQECYEGDFQARLERTGNYRQLTNNYKRGSPDSCSAPLTELVLPFYKTEPVPFEGCLR